MQTFFLERRPHKGLTYSDYMEQMRREAERCKEHGAGPDDYVVLNYRRSLRIQKTYEVPGPLRMALGRIKEAQLWMVLTEPWCGDSAQCLPYIAAFAACNPRIDLRILLRDQNPDIMDLYLTQGKRGIPKLVAFSEDGRELFQWGPRPKEAAQLFLEERAAGRSKEEIFPNLHLWYARDHGRAIEREFAELLTRVGRSEAEHRTDR